MTSLPAAGSPPPGQGGAPRAGVSKVDITPPPGLSLFGHGPEGRISFGHRGRLYCRSLVVLDGQGERFAWVICDLAAVSTLLHRRVVERTVGTTGIGADRFILSATHTHAGPAHYFAAPSYTGTLSTQNPGYDPAVVDWLAERIAAGLRIAVDSATRSGPVALGWSHGVMHASLTRNRSVGPHCRNHDPMVGGPTTCEQQPDPLVEVDKRVSVLRVDRYLFGKKVPVGAFAVVAMHPTTISNTNDVYHGDVLGLAARDAELRMGGGVVVAIANGFLGDVSPRWQRQTWAEADRLGRGLSEEVRDAWAEAVTERSFRVERAYREVDLPKAAVGRDGLKLCCRGELGNAAAGGAEDGRTRFWGHGPMFREGAVDPNRGGCQGPKPSLEGKLSGKKSFPLFVPLHAVLLGNAMLTTLPGEMTTTAGLRLRKRVEHEAGMPVVTVGLSNAYLQYIATEEEYQLQHYEGASTLYGPSSAVFFEERLAELARAVVHGGSGRWNEVPAREIAVSGEARRMPSTPPHRSKYRVLGMPTEPGELSTRWVEWEGASPGDVDVYTGPMVRVEVKTGRGWEPARDELGAELDDRSPAMWVKSRRALAGRWIAGWKIGPDTASGRYRFVVWDRDGSALPSPSFEVRP